MCPLKFAGFRPKLTAEHWEGVRLTWGFHISKSERECALGSLLRKKWWSMPHSVLCGRTWGGNIRELSGSWGSTCGKMELEPEIIEFPRWWSHTAWGYNWNMGIQMNYCSSRGPQERVCPRKSHALPVNSHVLLIKGDQHTAEAIASDENRLGRIVRWGKGGA